jgi:hypothetical protein
VGYQHEKGRSPGLDALPAFFSQTANSFDGGVWKNQERITALEKEKAERGR